MSKESLLNLVWSYLPLIQPSRPKINRHAIVAVQNYYRPESFVKRQPHLWHRGTLDSSHHTVFRFTLLLYSMTLEQTEGKFMKYKHSKCFQTTFTCSFIPRLVDLKAFERRLTEVIAALQPATGKWRGLYEFSAVLYNISVH